MTDLHEILKAKAEAVRALADAIGQRKNLGDSAGFLAVFAENWVQAIESMLPAESENLPGHCATCGGEHSTDGIYAATAGKRITLAELTARLGLPEHEQEAVFSWTGELDRNHTWWEAAVPDMIEAWKNDAERIEREG